MGVTDPEIEEAVREAWGILYAGSAASPPTRRLATALLAITKGTMAHPHWVTPDDLWRDRLAVLADQDAWLAAATGSARLPNSPCPAAGKPNAARERLFPVALDGVDQH